MEEIYRILVEKKVIDNQNILIGTNTRLYSFIKRFNQLGYFNKTTIIELHPLVNEKFKCTGIYQAIKQTPPYDIDDILPYQL